MTVTADIEDRIAKCQKILDVDPNSQIFAALAEAYRKRGELDKSFRICQTGLKTHPEYGSAHIVMAKINMDRGMYDWAEAEVKKAVEIDGGGRAIDLLLAEIYIYKGEFEAAVRLLKSLHQSDPNNRQIRKLLDIAEKIPEERKASFERTSVPAAVETEPSTGESAETDEYVDASLEAGDVLREAVLIEQLNGALFVNPEGLVVESEWKLTLDAASCGASLTETVMAVNQELVKYEFGEVSSMLIENGQWTFYLMRVDNGIFVFVGSEKTNLGALRMKLTELFDKYRAQ